MPKRKVKTVTTRHGDMSFYEGDGYVGLSLETYGEFAASEQVLLKKVLREGDVTIDCGANIGGLTIPMAELVGPTGKVYAFEASRDNAKLLQDNVEQTGHTDVVEVFAMAASDVRGKLPINTTNAYYPKVDSDAVASDFIKAMPIDDLKLPACRLIKIDVDGCEQRVIDGAAETIKRCRPVLYVENEIPDKAEKLVATIVEHGYRCYSFLPPPYSPQNWNNIQKNVFPQLLPPPMLLCIPEESEMQIHGCVEVVDIRMNDDDMFNREAARFERISNLWPNDLSARLLAAHYHALMQRMDKANELIEENIRRDPNHLATQAIQGLHMLQRGEWKEGWKRYEMRYSQANPNYFGGNRKPKTVPMWDGQPTDEPLLVWSEQGFGDTIMFSRLYKYVKQRAPNALLEVQAELYELFETSKIEPEGRLYRMGRTLPDLHGKHVSIPSLPFVLGVDSDEMLRMDKPYLFADPVLTTRFVAPGCGIGLCTKGSPRSERPYTRDVPSDKFYAIARDFGPLFSLNNEGQFESYAVTAAAINASNLVITVDTSVAHLAGAMGKETWLLLAWDPDFRWGLHKDACVWYPSMKIFRQRKFRDWNGVLDEVYGALEERYRLKAA